MGFVVLVLGLLGCAGLALAMPQHGGERAARQRWLLRLGGGGALAAALALCLGGWGVTVGLVVWCGTLMVAALSVAMGLAYGRPARKT
jgi:hypothetical protein